MQDPIGSFERIREFYISYLDTAFRIADAGVAEARRALLREPGQLCTEPLVEPLPRYEWDALEGGGYRTFEQLVEDDSLLAGMDTESRLAFVDIVLAGLFPSDARTDMRPGAPSRIGRFPPYKHQVAMLRRGVQPTTPGVVTSGTGSGKTESFLLPLLARLSREARNWKPPADEFLSSRWWHDDDGRPFRTKNKKGRTVVRFSAIPRVRRPDTGNPLRSPVTPHRAGERRPAAMRAIILYPMNALVEDQLVRLRKALDSAEARDAMDRHFAGNRIFFGRYTGATPVTGHDANPGLKKLLSTPKKEVSGSIYFPAHKKADKETGIVELVDVWATEYEKRKRKLEELFDHSVGLERGQLQARLNALDSTAAEVLSLELRTSNPGSVSPKDFLDAARTAGKRSRDALRRDFREWVGSTPDDEQARALSDLELTEQDAKSAPSAHSNDDAAFIFPSVDGSELTNRWDMHTHPPDVLITNVSMLSAMLNREVEDPIFEKTRAWLEEEDSYFYLILDELHLQRGASGTEVAYLVRLLLERLGLTKSESQRRKLRVLASSASLPAHPPDEAKKSAKYLWDMFGPFGLEPGIEEKDGREAWLDSIVSGSERPPKYDADGPDPLEVTPFVRLLELHTPKEPLDMELPRAAPLFARDPFTSPEVAAGWSEVANALSISEMPLARRIATSIEEVAQRLAWACRERDEHTGSWRSRATALRKIATKLFTPVPDDADVEPEDAVRALLFIRGSGDGMAPDVRDFLDSPPSFRVHTFFRSIEGLYAPASRNAGERITAASREVEVGQLSIDQSPRVIVDGPAGRAEHRAYEVLYCECCGDLFFGGMRAKIGRKGRYIAELLPQEHNLDGLPDQAVSQRFEDLSWSTYGLFWPGPWDLESLTETTQDTDVEKWCKAYLERPSGGIIRKDKLNGEPSPELLAGWYLGREERLDRPHKRSKTTAGTHVPYMCPKCGTSYARRSKEYRLSPIRNFRAGFGKTTQLLATELFDAQRLANTNNDPKLVSFSDSRQDAAKAALSIERLHHQDIRREVLFSALRHEFEQRDVESATRKLDKARTDLAALSADSSFRTGAEETVRKLEIELEQQREQSVALGNVLEGRQDVAGANRPALPFIAAMVRIGVHPFDEAGKERARGAEEGKDYMRFPWTRMFHEPEDVDTVYWADDSDHQVALESARNHMVATCHKLLTDVVFSKTYFSFEEAGLGYATVPLRNLPPERRTKARASQIASFIRVLADSYRYDPSPYLNEKADERHTPWTAPGEVGPNHRARRFVANVGLGDTNDSLAELLADLEACGHRDGVIQMERVHIRLVQPDDEFVRCNRCGRVHLHAGFGICTRCLAPLSWASAEKNPVRVLHDRNFLARRIFRAGAPTASSPPATFRLHCEELTGQTEEPARRQREFKGIFLPRLASVEANGENALVLDAPNPLYRRKQEIDLLTVTTTMEVGIDIGPLQTVLQANMPPQRFNYQQRVGRAGRRGQAFSMALTICRTKSHDLFYFRHPEKMTGDIPPTPFLTKRMTAIAERFVRKGWLWRAFRNLRADTRKEGSIYPADLMSPPDIHGEYLPTDHLPNAAGVDWLGRVHTAIDAAADYASTLAETLALGSSDLGLKVTTAGIRTDLDRALREARQVGLAHSLAEAGSLPMYGMPTRVRQLYLRLRSDGNRTRWSTVDRDLDVAIYEFAPGSTVVIDKAEHMSIGFTPNLGDPMPGARDQELQAFQDSAFSEPYQLIECHVCRTWTRAGGEDQREDCRECGSKLHTDRPRTCRVPNAFRTDLPAFPRTRQEDVDSGVRHRSIQAEGRDIDIKRVDGFGPDGSWALGLAHQYSETFRLNRGPAQDDGEHAFEFQEGIETRTYRGTNLALHHQCISTDAKLNRRVEKTFGQASRAERTWLAAPKVTDAIFLAPTAIRAGLSLHKIRGRLDGDHDDREVTRWIGLRAAAISASYLIVNRASLKELDIDPEEFDVLEPRPHGKRNRRPLLHITDNLVNGAGFCEFLASSDEEGPPRIARILESMLCDERTYPLTEFLDPEHDCNTSCYRCLRRYGNQPFHAILDWQLGMTYLRSLVDSGFSCGIDGRFDEHGIRNWPEQSATIASQMARRFGGEASTFEGVPAFTVKHRRGTSPWVLVAHPFWDWQDELPVDSILAKARDAAGEHGEPLCWDTFNLARRQVFVRERIREDLLAR